MAKQRWQSDYWLWAIATTAAFIALGFVDIAGGMSKGKIDLWSLFKYLGGEHNTEAALTWIVFRSLLQAGPALLIGWLIQALAVMCGLRLAGRSSRNLTAGPDHADPGANTRQGMRNPVLRTE